MAIDVRKILCRAADVSGILIGTCDGQLPAIMRHAITLTKFCNGNVKQAITFFGVTNDDVLTDEQVPSCPLQVQDLASSARNEFWSSVTAPRAASRVIGCDRSHF